jgi:hypothetical protein
MALRIHVPDPANASSIMAKMNWRTRITSIEEDIEYNPVVDFVLVYYIDSSYLAQL